MQLADDDAFRPVDDERSPFGHERQVAEIDHLFDGIRQRIVGIEFILDRQT